MSDLNFIIIVVQLKAKMVHLQWFRGKPKSLDFILWRPRMSAQHFHPTGVGLFQSGLKVARHPCFHRFLIHFEALDQKSLMETS